MDKKEAINNLILTGRLFWLIGISGIIGTIIYYKLDTIIIKIIKLIFALAFIYFGKLILDSTKFIENNN